MNLSEIASLTNASFLCCEDKKDGIAIENAYACDLMSDVLAFCTPGALLMTGLTNIQIVRTAQMLDIPAVLFVRGKKPQDETIKLAEENGIPLLLSGFSLYEACGVLYREGISPCAIVSRGK